MKKNSDNDKYKIEMPDADYLKDYTYDSEKYNACAAAAKARWDSIAKPIDSLGLLEGYVTRLCAISGSDMPCDISKRALVILCADHGVVSEKVTQTGSEVTRLVAENFAAGRSSVNYMAACAGADVYTVDIGMDTEHYTECNLVQGAVIDRKISRGTLDLAVAAAMTRRQCIKAIDTGMELVRQLKAMGYGIIATGEMGIGNTTPTACVGAYLLNLTPEQVTGRGAGLDDSGMERKLDVIRRALDRVNMRKPYDVIDIMAELGGYELAGMMGIYLGGVRYRVPVIMDGVISVVAALAAYRMDNRVKNYILASHVSEEPLADRALSALGMEAAIHGHMCLGEGSGAVSLLPLLDMGVAVYCNMVTFGDLNIEAYDRSGKPGKSVQSTLGI